MAETGLVSDYIGRKFDLLALPGAKAVGDTLLRQELFGPNNAGGVCAGAQKLAQDWAIEFMLVRGSMPFDDARGNDFVRAARAGRLRTESEVVAAFIIAAMAVKETLLQRVPETTPDDERLASVQLLGVRIAAGELALHVAITSVAGDSRKIILPVTTVPANLAVR